MTTWDVLGKIEALALRFMAHPVVDYYESGHRFDDGYRTGYHTGIMATTPHQLGFVAVFIDGVLLLDKGCGRLEGHAKDQLFAVADPALHTARAVGRGADLAVFIDKYIIVLGALL